MNNRTRYVPALITLTAGFIACISMIVHEYTTKEILLITTGVMVIFLLVGLVVRFIMDTFIFVKKPNDEEDKENEENEDESKKDEEKDETGSKEKVNDKDKDK